MTEMTFGETVKAERVKRGWSQQVLANRAGMNRSHIGGIELKPGLPQYGTIVSIAKAFGMTPRELLAPTGTTIMEAAAPYDVGIEADELVALFDLLSEDDRDRLVAIARALWQRTESS
mgnify:CR=1 FL=1